MLKKLQGTNLGFIILGVLWLMTLILIWPRNRAQSDDGASHEAPVETPTVAEIPIQPVDQTMDLLVPTPELIFEPTPIPTPLPTPTPELLLTNLHTVQPGDTIQSIAQMHNTSIALLAIRLTAMDLTPGNTIQIPVPNPAACPSGKLHVVEQNQTLYGLSRLYNVEIEALMSTNNLGSDLIHIGDILCLPPGGF